MRKIGMKASHNARNAGMQNRTPRNRSTINTVGQDLGRYLGQRKIQAQNTHGRNNQSYLQTQNTSYGPGSLHGAYAGSAMHTARDGRLVGEAQMIPIIQASVDLKQSVRHHKVKTNITAADFNPSRQGQHGEFPTINHDNNKSVS